MKIAFVGNKDSVNAQSWINGLLAVEPSIEFVYWSKEDSIKGKSPYYRGFSLFTSVKKLKSFLNSEKPDIVLAYRTTSYGYLAARTGYKPLVVACQGETDLYGINKYLLSIKKWCKKVAVLQADMIHAWGTNMVPSLLEHGATNEKVLVMPRGIDVKRFQFSEDKIQNNQLKMVVTRGIYPEYHHEVIVEAAKIINNKGIDFTIDIIGDGASKNAIESLVREYKLEDKVKLLGKIPYSMVQEHLKKCNVYVSVPETEGTSSSLLEAIAMGLFPIVSDLPANRNWVRDGENGFLTPYYDANVLADKIERLQNEWQFFQPALKSNRALIEEKADITKNMNYFIQCYQSLIAKYKK